MQNCFLFDVIKFKSWGSLADLLCFQACRLQTDKQIDRRLQLQLPLHYTRLHYTIPHYSTRRYSTLQCTTLIASHHNYNYNCKYTALFTHYNYNSTTPHYNYNYNCTTPHYIQQLWVRWPLQPLQTPKNTTSTTLRSISGFALPSVIHNNQPLL